MRFGIVGMGKMGAGLATQAIERGHSVVGFDVAGVSPALVELGVHAAGSLRELVEALSQPRLVLLYVPHGAITEKSVEDVGGLLAPGDILADGGNSHFRDSARRALAAERRGVHYLDIGTSGGVEGARGGACFMVGGNAEAFKIVEPLLCDLAVPEGVAHVGGPGAGHFAKLIHNAIEFGMVQAIAEGVALLKSGEYQYDLPKLFHNWAHGSVIRGWLIELAERAFRTNPKFELLSNYIEDTREVRWAVEHALEREVWTPVIAQSEMAFYQYRDRQSITAKVVGMLRHEFGGHPLHRNDEAREPHSKHQAHGELGDGKALKS